MLSPTFWQLISESADILLGIIINTILSCPSFNNRFFLLLPLFVGCFEPFIFYLEFPRLLLALVRPVNPLSCALWFHRYPMHDGSCLHRCIRYFTFFVGFIVPQNHTPPPFVRVRSLTSCFCGTCLFSFSVMLLRVLGVICTHNTNLENYCMVTLREQQGNDCPALQLFRQVQFTDNT